MIQAQVCPIRHLRGTIAFLAGVVALVPGGFAAAGPAPPATVPALRLEPLPLQVIAARLSQESGVRVVVDQSVANQRIRLETVGGPLERVLEQVVVLLPAGATLRKVLLPPALPGATIDGDQVAALVQAQDVLVRPINGATPLGPEDMVVQGRIVPAAQVETVSASLGLKPVFLFTNGKAVNDPIARANRLQAESLRLWLSLTAQQQQALADQQFDSFFNMDPSLRRAMMQQMMQLSLGMMQKIQQLSPEQRQAFLDEIRNALPPGTVPGSGLRR